MTDDELIGQARSRVQDHRELVGLGLINREGRFSPSGIHYPPITRYPEIAPAQLLEGYQAPEDERFVLYIHIPYCARRCTFCHYPVKTGASEVEKDAYTDLLLQELEIWRRALGVDRIGVESMLIAGGTPTFMGPTAFARFHRELAQAVDMSACSQVGYDVHPVDMLGEEGMERLRIMRDFGGDRLTMGLQSLDDAILKHMGRGHTQVEAHRALENMRRAGFDDICIEFIFGYPGVTLPIWLETLKKAVATEVEEIQFYRLKVEPYGDSPGPITRLHHKKPAQFSPAEEEILMKQAAILMLGERGYHENLTRVFTRKPDQISHYASDQCCRQLDCLGIGQSAFSSFRDRFSINTPDLDAYGARVRAGELPLNRGIVRDRDASLRWHLLLPLKNSWLTKEIFFARTGEHVDEVFRRELDALVAHGLVHEDDQVVQLTEKGRFFADEVCAQLHHPDHLPEPLDAYEDGPLKLARPLPGRSAGPARVPAAAPACGLRAPGRPWPWTLRAAEPVHLLSPSQPDDAAPL